MLTATTASAATPPSSARAARRRVDSSAGASSRASRSAPTRAGSDLRGRPRRETTTATVATRALTDDSATTTNSPWKAPPSTCTGAAAEARQVLRLLREGAARADASVPRRVRVELPLPPADMDTDAMVYLGLHGQAADWSGGMQQRLRVTKALIDGEGGLLDGYADAKYLGLLDRDADGMGVWTLGEDLTIVTHPSDTTMRYFLDLCRGEYGNRVRDDSHVLCAVNAFWSGDGASAGDRVGQPWELGLKREAKEVLTRDGDWDVVYCARRIRSAAGVEGTLRRAWPGPWRLFDAEGVTLVMERASQPSNREMAEALN